MDATRLSFKLRKSYKISTIDWLIGNNIKMDNVWLQLSYEFIDKCRSFRGDFKFYALKFLKAKSNFTYESNINIFFLSRLNVFFNQQLNLFM